METTSQASLPHHNELENNLNFRQIVNNIGGTFWLLSADLNEILYISPNYKQLFGIQQLTDLPPQEALDSIIHPDDREYIAQKFNSFLHTGKFTEEFRIIRPDGEIRWISSSAFHVYDDQNQLIRHAGLIHDITESKVKDQKLRFQTQLQELLTKISNTYINLPADRLHETLKESVHDLGEFVGADRFYIYEYRPDEELFYNTYEWCNEGIDSLMKSMQGITPTDMDRWMMEHRRIDFYIVEDVAALRDNDALKTMLLAQGVKSMILVPLIDHGQYTGFMGIDAVRTTKQFGEEEKQLLKIFAQTVVSAWQRIRSEEALAKALENANESDRLKSAFLATISHELRTPLNHILGFGALIRDHSSEKHIKEFAADLCTSGNGLLGMIEDMFALSLAEKSAMIVRTSQVKGVELYMACKELLTEMLHSSGKNELIKLHFKPDHALMTTTLITDRQKIQQVLTNLFNNAVKFTPSGTIEFGIARTRDSLKMYVSDTGIGIPADQQQHIFDLFRQLDDGINRHYGGLGIGLSMSKKLAEVLGGRLSVESEPGKGSCFYFTVPVQFI